MISSLVLACFAHSISTTTDAINQPRYMEDLDIVCEATSDSKVETPCIFLPEPPTLYLLLTKRTEQCTALCISTTP